MISNTHVLHDSNGVPILEDVLAYGMLFNGDSITITKTVSFGKKNITNKFKWITPNNSYFGNVFAAHNSNILVLMQSNMRCIEISTPHNIDRIIFSMAINVRSINNIENTITGLLCNGHIVVYRGSRLCMNTNLHATYTQVYLDAVNGIISLYYGLHDSGILSIGLFKIENIIIELCIKKYILSEIIPHEKLLISYDNDIVELNMQSLYDAHKTVSLMTWNNNIFIEKILKCGKYTIAKYYDRTYSIIYEHKLVNIKYTPFTKLQIPVEVCITI